MPRKDLQSKINELRRICIKNDPSIAAIGIGCEVLVGKGSSGQPLRHMIYGYDDEKYCWTAYLVAPFPKDLKGNSFYDCNIPQGAIASGGVQVLGRRLHLADLLNAAIKGPDFFDDVVIPFVDWWNLAKDDLELQSRDTIEKIYIKLYSHERR